MPKHVQSCQKIWTYNDDKVLGVSIVFLKCLLVFLWFVLIFLGILMLKNHRLGGAKKPWSRRCQKTLVQVVPKNPGLVVIRFVSRISNVYPLNVVFPAVWALKTWLRKLRDAYRKNFHLVACLKTSVVTSMVKKQDYIILDVLSGRLTQDCQEKKIKLPKP